MALMTLLLMTVIFYAAAAAIYLKVGMLFVGSLNIFNAVVGVVNLVRVTEFHLLVALGLLVALLNLTLAMLRYSTDPSDDPERRTVTGR